jgi:DNA end-binding protein Ku
MPATVWSGYLTFGLISMPVRLYSGARSTRISFHMLHKKDLTRVKQQLFCPNDDEVISRDDIVKGYEYRKGEYIVVDPSEIKKIEPKTAKAMEIMEFVKQEEIDPVYFESSYYLAPDEAGKKPYALLQRAMKETGFVAVAKLAMHNREYTVFLRTYEHGLMLHTMYYQEEIREAPSVGSDKVDIREPEVKVAHQLIQALASEWDASKYHDVFEDNLKKLIKAKMEGGEVTAVEKPAKPAAPADLMEALRRSLAEIGDKKKGPQRVEAVQQQSEVHVTHKKASSSRKKTPRRAA